MKNLFFVFIFFSCLSANAQVSDPIPEPIRPSLIIPELHDFITIPPSSSDRPFTRINLLREVPDGSGRLFVNDLRGNFWIIKNNTPTLYADLKEIFNTFIDEPGKGTGFGAFAFHPEFTVNGLFYTSHAEAAGTRPSDFEPIVDNGISMQWVITEWQTEDVTADEFQGNRREILRVDYPGHLHGIQDVSFNPTAVSGDDDYGNLYICFGDGGSSLNFLSENLQSKKSFQGTIFRIDPLGNNSRNGQYGIPDDNPFVNNTDPEILKEIYAYGFRNPHRICWDVAGDQKMLVGEIGEKNIEEVNLIMPGRNYGWDTREGTFLYDRSLGRENVYELPADDSPYNFTYPVAQFDHDEAVAIIGGYVYQGNAVPQLKGEYIFGDIPSGKIFHVTADQLELGKQATIKSLAFRKPNRSGTSLLQLVNDTRVDLRFGQSLSGEVYLLSKSDGKIRIMKDPTSTMVTEKSATTTNIKLIPNPTSGIFEVGSSEALVFPMKVQVFAPTGKLIFEKSNFQKADKINLTPFPDGLYSLRFGNSRTAKIIKKSN